VRDVIVATPFPAGNVPPLRILVTVCFLHEPRELASCRRPALDPERGEFDLACRAFLWPGFLRITADRGRAGSNLNPPRDSVLAKAAIAQQTHAVGDGRTGHEIEVHHERPARFVCAFRVRSGRFGNRPVRQLLEAFTQDGHAFAPVDQLLPRRRRIELRRLHDAFEKTA
jgi:hypothetical protein